MSSNKPTNAQPQNQSSGSSSSQTANTSTTTPTTTTSASASASTSITNATAPTSTTTTSTTTATNANVQPQNSKKPNTTNANNPSTSATVGNNTNAGNSGSMSQLPINQTQANLSQTTQPIQSIQMNKNTKATKPQPEDMKEFEERQKVLQESSTNLIINYIPPDMNEGALGTLFSPYGTMQNIKIVVDTQTGRSRGYGFVKYESSESANRAQKALNGYIIGGKKLKVAYSRPQSKEIQNSNLYVTNVPLDWDNERLGQVFKPFGFVVESRILVDQEGRSRGVGFVRMDNNANALKAISGIHSYGIDGGVELVVKLAQRKNQNRRWGMNPSGDYINDGNGQENRPFNHRNTGRRSGAMMSDQGDPNKNYEAQMSGGFYKRGSSNRKQMYRPRNDQMADLPSNGEADFYPPSYDPYMQPMAYYGPQGMREPGASSGIQQTGGISATSMPANNRQYTAQAFNVVVRNLPNNFNVDHLIKLYAPFGPIQSVHIEKAEQHSSGHLQPPYGIVSYFFPDDAKNAVTTTHGKVENGCSLHVSWQ